MMLPLETILLFFSTSVLLALAPGPDNLFVLAQSAQHGRKAGVIVTLGLCSGVLVHTAAVTFGVAAIFHTSALAFSMLKYIGAAYLLYLAWMSFKASGAAESGKALQKISFRKLYLRGIIMNVTNPKVSIFFLAFLPQFVDPSGNALSQSLFIASLHFCVGIVYLCTLAALVGKAKEFVKASGITRSLHAMSGAVFIYLGLRLAASD